MYLPSVLKYDVLMCILENYELQKNFIKTNFLLQKRRDVRGQLPFHNL